MTVEQLAISLAISALSGLGGAVLGAWAVLRAQDRDREHREKSAGRAVHLEMSMNSALLHAIAARQDGWDGLSAAAWTTQMPLLAATLSASQLAVVSRGYFFLPSCMRLLEAAVRKGLTDSDKLFLSETAGDFDAGIAVLGKLVWTDAEMAGLAELGRS